MVRMHDIVDPILSEGEYRAWVNLSAPTAQRQRSDGSGPPFVQLSQRRIGYRKSAVERWLEARTINRVGALVSAEEPPKPSLSPGITATVTADDAETGHAYEAALGERPAGGAK
jgi:predicted DNA-binding transcriptional regulator AlpA